MPDMKKVIKAIDICLGHGRCYDCEYHSAGCYTDQNCRKRMMNDVLALLKEQDDLENDALIAMDLNYELNKKLKEQPEIVRCQDCKHRPKQTRPPQTYGFSIEFPEGSRCPCQCDDGFYSWYPEDDWFCADGERR